MKVNGHTVIFIKQENPTHVFFCNFFQSFSENVFYRTPLETVSEIVWECYLLRDYVFLINKRLSI